MLFHSIRSLNTLSYGSIKPNCVLGFSANRMWLFTRFYVFLFIRNASVINNNDQHNWIMCVVVAELTEALVSTPREVSDPSSSPIRNISVLFLTIPDEYNYFYSFWFPSNKIIIIFIRRDFRQITFFYSSRTIPDEYNYFYSSEFPTNNDDNPLFPYAAS